MTVYGVHAEGEVGRVITGGVIDVPGETMLDKMLYMNKEDDSIRRFVLYEPRGSAQMSANLLLPPTQPEADAAFIVMQPDCCHALSGSNTMCVATSSVGNRYTTHERASNQSHSGNSCRFNSSDSTLLQRQSGECNARYCAKFC